MPKFNNLAGFCRDLRTAALAAAEGNQEAAKLCDAAYDALGLLDAFVEGDLDCGENPDADASGDESLDEGDVAAGKSLAEVRGERMGRVDSVGGVGHRPTLRSTRAGMRQAAQAARVPSGAQAFEAGVPRTVGATGRSPGGNT